MNNYDVHVCLVSKQAMPNLLPVLDEAWRPGRVVLAASPQMRGAAQALERVIKGKGQKIGVEILDLPDAYDYAALFDRFLNFLAEHEHEDVALNVSGGTKLMAVAAQEAFRVADKPVIYVNVESDEVILIGKASRSQPLRASLTVRQTLEAHEFGIEHQQQPQVTRDLRDACARIIDHVGSSGPALGQLNYIAAKARSAPRLRIQLNDAQFDSRSLAQMIGLFVEAGQLVQEGKWLEFKDEAARQFVNGGWLELHAFQVLQDLRGSHDRFSDVVMNMVAVHPDGTTRNEADVAFLYRNTLHLIECKTANLAPEGIAVDDKATQAIYKLETLLKLGGLRTRGMIVDYRGALSAHPPNLERARSAGIEVVSGKQLQNLKGILSRAWLQG
jgi:hypothetical protein